MANNVNLTQEELDRLFATKSPSVKSERDIIQDQIRDKFQSRITQAQIDEIMGKGDTQNARDEQDEFSVAISQDELDKLFKK